MKPLSLPDRWYVAERARHAFQHLNGARVVITGAGGFVGSWCADTLQGNGSPHFAWLTTHSRSPESRSPRANDHLFVDIRQLELPTGTTHVIHCANAASHAENQRNPDAVCDMIIHGTRHVANECARVGAKLLLMSSGSVYMPGANGDEQAYTEADPRRLRFRSVSDQIALAKVDAEDIALNTNPNTVIARGFAMLGPRLGPQFAAAEFMRTALQLRTLTVKGSGATVRSYLYAADLCAYLWHILAFGKPGEAYNVGSGDTCTIGTLACHVAAAAGLDVERDIAWGHASKDAAPMVPDVTKLRALYAFHEQFTPLTPLESIQRWIQWERT